MERPAARQAREEGAAALEAGVRKARKFVVPREITERNRARARYATAEEVQAAMRQVLADGKWLLDRLARR